MQSTGSLAGTGHKSRRQSGPGAASALVAAQLQWDKSKRLLQWLLEGWTVWAWPRGQATAPRGYTGADGRGGVERVFLEMFGEEERERLR